MTGALLPALGSSEGSAGLLLLNVSSLLLDSSSSNNNVSLENWTANNESDWSSNNVTVTEAKRHLSTAAQAIITASYVLGVVGNAAALLILSREARGATSPGRNASKHALMLRCLAWNDLVALLGMLVLMNAQLYLPPTFTGSQGFCAARVTMRLFGLGSGVVALVMAAERWLALSHPFFYQKHVTYHMIRNMIFLMWALVVCLVYMPLFGFGIYYEEGPPMKCVRYRQATDPVGTAYAYVYFTFGSLLCVGIVFFNLAVMRSLCSLGRRVMLDRRVSNRHGNQVNNPSYRSLSQQQQQQSSQRHNAATHEEIAFARLMAALCVIFIVCWMPQMLAIPVSRLMPRTKNMLRAADILMSFHFALDPYIYVLLRCRRRPCVQAVLKFMCRPLRPASKQASIRTNAGTGEVQLSMQDTKHTSETVTPPSKHILRQQHEFL